MYDDWNTGLRRCPENMSFLKGPKKHINVLTTKLMINYIIILQLAAFWAYETIKFQQSWNKSVA